MADYPAARRNGCPGSPTQAQCGDAQCNDAQLTEEPGSGLALIEGSVTLPDVIEGLNAHGVSPRDMIDILKSIKAAGALHAEFEVQ